MKKKIIPVFVMLALILAAVSPSAGAWVGDIKANYSSAVGSVTSIVYNVTDKQVVFVNNPTRRIQVASTTKVLTACVASQYFAPDDVLYVGAEQNLVKSYASRASVFSGQSYTFEQLLAAMLIPSGCDAAYAIAANAARKATGNYSLGASAAVSTFVRMMNDFCKKLGCVDSVWLNPDGQDEWSGGVEQHTTISDYVKVAEYAINNPTIASVVKNYYYVCYDRAGGYHYWTTTNAMINPYSDYYDPDIIGIKTGLTNNAGSCLMLAIDKHGSRFITYVVGCSGAYQRYTLSQRLIDITDRYLSRRGDINDDGEKNVFDARCILRIAIGLDPYLDRAVADMNIDGEITVEDARLALRKCIGLPMFE